MGKSVTNKLSENIGMPKGCGSPADTRLVIVEAVLDTAEQTRRMNRFYEIILDADLKAFQVLPE